MKNEMKQVKPVVAKSQDERDVWVCISTQKIGLASIKEICNKIEGWNGRITEKQVSTSAENLRMRGILSIDLSTKDDNGISIKKYKMKSIKVSIPEVGQVRDIVDNEDIKPLIEELDRSKKTRKKGMKTFDYYVADVTFKTKGCVQGFIPDKDGLVKHYRDGENVVLYGYHFRNWFRSNLPLINRASSAIGDIKFIDGEVNLNGEMITIEKYITNVESGFSSSRGTGGRGSWLIECLPTGTTIKTSFAIPRELINPTNFGKALDIFGKFGSSFGGGAKLSTGKLIPENVEIVSENLLDEE